MPSLFRHFTLSFFLLFCIPSFGNQDNYIVSKKEYPELRQLLDSAKIYFRSDLEKSFAFAKRAELISKDYQNKKALLEVYLNYIKYHSHSRNEFKVRQYKSLCFELLKESPNAYLEAEILHACGLDYMIAGKQNLAIEEYQKALKINREYGFSDGEMRQLNHIGVILVEQEYYEKAISYFADLRAMAEDLAAEKHVNYSLANLGYCNMKLGNYEEALAHTEHMVRYCEETEDRLSLCMGYSIYAEILGGLNRNAEAINVVNKAIQLSKEQSISFTLAEGYRIKAQILFDMDSLNESHSYSKKAYSLSKQSNTFRNYEELLSIKFKIEESLGLSTEQAKTLFELYEFNDSINGIKAKNQIEQATLLYEIEQSNKENELLKLKQASSELAIENTQFYNGILILSILSVTLLSGMLYLLYHRKRKYNQELEKNIKIRTAELEQSNRELERYSFIASHDLKEPVRTISSFSKLLEETIEQNSFSKSKEYLRFIQANSERMQKLIEDILEFSQINSSKKFEEEELDLNELIQDVIALNQKIISNSNASINCGNLPSIMGNKTLWTILLKNLIENGIKYNESQQPHIELHFEKGDKYGTLAISDNGIGIPKEHKEEIFEMFKRLHDLRKYQGTGIGLSMCKKIIEMHGGFITLDSRLGKGSKFSIHLPNRMFKMIIAEETLNEMAI